MEDKSNITNLDRMLKRQAAIQAALDGLQRSEWNKQKAKVDRLAADIEHEEGIQRWQQKKAEADRVAQQEALLKEQVRKKSVALANLGETLERDYEDAADQIVKVWTKSGNLSDEVCNFDFHNEPEFIGLFRPEYHVHQLCRCLHARGFRPIIDAIKNYHPGPLADEVQMADYLCGVNVGDVANKNDAPANDGGAEK